MAQKNAFMLLIVIWALIALACNLPLVPGAAPPAAPTRPLLTLVVTAVDNQLPPTATLRSQPATQPPPAAATATPRATLLVTVTLAATVATPDESEALSLDYDISWQLDPNDPNFALATVTLFVSGGDGNYTFFRDGKPTGGPQFVYRWGSCQDNPGIFRVDDGSGESAQLEYFEQAPCPNS